MNHLPTNRVLVNTLPKSGTHLLSKAVELLGYREHFDNPDTVNQSPMFLNYREAKNALAGYTFSEQEAQPSIPIGTLVPFYVPASIVRQWLAFILPGRYMLGHITWTANLGPILAELGFRHIAIIRDPRAVVASLLAFILDTRGMPKPHFLEADFKIRSSRQQLDLILNGGYADQAGLQIQSFAEIYRAMLAWQQDPDCLLVRFEDLIGSQGGGSDEKQQLVIAKIADHLHQPLITPMPTVYSTSARTFRQGKVDGWKEGLEQDVVEYLSCYCEPLCTEAGY